MKDIKPENQISWPKKIEWKDIVDGSRLLESDIGKWAVFGSSKTPVVCSSYQEAAELASAFNRCPA